MQTFNVVVDAGSFVKAEEAFNLSKAAVWRYVVDLETRLGVRLLHRTTRRLSLTQERQVFYARSEAARWQPCGWCCVRLRHANRPRWASTRCTQPENTCQPR